MGKISFLSIGKFSCKMLTNENGKFGNNNNNNKTITINNGTDKTKKNWREI